MPLDTLKLRPLKSEDFDFVQQLWQDKNVRAYLGGTKTQERIQRDFARLTKAKTFICLLEEKPCGVLYLNPYQNTPYDEVSYEFAPIYWGNGIAYHALCLLFSQMEPQGTQQVYAETQLKNTRSNRLLQKLGMRKTKEIMRFGELQCVYVYTFISETQL